MKVILLKDTPKVGQKNAIVEVKSGYALNFLIPNGFALMATAGLEKKIQKKKESEEKENKEKLERLQKDLAELSKAEIKVKANANENGHLFAALGKKELILAIKEQSGKEIPEKILELLEEIKEVGEREVEARAGDKSFKLKLTVEAE